MKRNHILLLTALLFSVLSAKNSAKAADHSADGFLLFHRYSSYSAQDGQLFLHNTTTNASSEISGSGFHHAMNADFGSHPYDIVFMAITTDADAWDIYLYNTITGKLVNLTENSGYRNEDPKFSPDGRSIVFKRGWWDSVSDGFVYELAELSLATLEVSLLTDGTAEESMPYYSDDGAWIYYAQSGSDADGIYRLERSTLQTEAVHTGGDHAYYPVVLGDELYFTKWYSSENPADCIMSLSDGILPFCDGSANYSDPCPLSHGRMIFSSTLNGSYDLYCWDGRESTPLTDCNTEQQELGAAFYSSESIDPLVSATSEFLLTGADSSCNMDADGNGKVDAFDLALFKKLR